MKITYTGRQVGLAPAELKKLEARFAKIGVLLDGKKECEVHVVLSQERHLHHAEATLQYFGHQLVGLGSDNDLFTAIHASADKLEKQAVKARTKWRDTQRTPRKEASEVETEGTSEAEVEGEEEPVLHLDKSRDYLVYRDTETDRIAVLIRRRDGNFDLIQS
jgi:putative sigma-54 modulation protein